MYKRIFLDANVIADLYDNSRIFHEHSKKAITYLLNKSDTELFTSCDIVTTLYYIMAKKDKLKALASIGQINEFCKIVEFSNKEITESCTLMTSSKEYKDLEDTIQYIMAKKVDAQCILSNDKGFISLDIELYTSSSFYEKYVK